MKLIIKLLFIWFVIGLLSGAIIAKADNQKPNIIINGEYVYINADQSNAIDINEAPPINDVSRTLDEVDANGHKMEYLGNFKVTYYCSCKRCNGSWGSIDGYGQPLRWGCVAVDPKVIPMHTRLVVDGYDTVFEARDTGSGVNGQHIDMYVPVSHSDALAMPQGQKLKVWKIYD